MQCDLNVANKNITTRFKLVLGSDWLHENKVDILFSTKTIWINDELIHHFDQQDIVCYDPNKINVIQMDSGIFEDSNSTKILNVNKEMHIFKASSEFTLNNQNIIIDDHENRSNHSNDNLKKRQQKLLQKLKNFNQAEQQKLIKVVCNNRNAFSDIPDCTNSRDWKER